MSNKCVETQYLVRLSEEFLQSMGLVEFLVFDIKKNFLLSGRFNGRNQSFPFKFPRISNAYPYHSNIVFFYILFSVIFHKMFVYSSSVFSVLAYIFKLLLFSASFLMVQVGCWWFKSAEPPVLYKFSNFIHYFKNSYFVFLWTLLSEFILFSSEDNENNDT